MLNFFGVLFPNLLQAVAITITAYFAVKGLDAWRRQTIGQRKIEVAEQALRSSFEAVEVIEYMRHPFSRAGEVTEYLKERGFKEEDLKDLVSSYYVPFKRANESDSKAVFAELAKVKILARIHIGDDAANAIETLLAVRHRVLTAAQMLIDLYPDEKYRTLKPQDRDLMTKWRSEIWSVNDDKNELTIEVKKAQDELEDCCIPLLK